MVQKIRFEPSFLDFKAIKNCFLNINNILFIKKEIRFGKTQKE
jgi:hypothetical protein